MEPQPLPAESDNQSNLRRLTTGFLERIHAAGRWLSVQDLNPHEGRLRGSQMPAEYMDIPDHPPLHDDNL